MKVIGTVDPTENQLAGSFEKEDQGGKYLGGGIVLLSTYEMKAVKMLQEACEGLRSDYLSMKWGKPKDAEIDDLFMLVYRFAEAKFAINDFKGRIKELENALGDNEK